MSKTRKKSFILNFFIKKRTKSVKVLNIKVMPTYILSIFLMIMQKIKPNKRTKIIIDRRM